MDEKILLGRILQQFIIHKYAQHPGYNKFEYVKYSKSAIYVTREEGKDTAISFAKILVGIKGYQFDLSMYDEGPAKLRELGLTHITSPIFALLHLLPKDAYK